MKKLRLRQASPCFRLLKLLATFGALVFVTERPTLLITSPCSWIYNNIKMVTQNRDPTQWVSTASAAGSRQSFPHLPPKAGLKGSRQWVGRTRGHWDGMTTC